MRTAVYSGSFDPLHKGHLAILRSLSEESRFDRTLLVVSPQNPLKEASKAESGQARYEAAAKALGRYPELKVTLDDIELRMPPPHYTIRTLDALRQREPDSTFTLVIGADNLAHIRRWKDYRRILLEFGVLVYPRKGFDTEALKQELLCESGEYRIELLDAPLVDISSTQIRNALASGQDVSEYLF